MTSGPWSSCPEGCDVTPARTWPQCPSHPGKGAPPNCWECFLIEGDRQQAAVEQERSEDGRALGTPKSESFFFGSRRTSIGERIGQGRLHPMWSPWWLGRLQLQFQPQRHWRAHPKIRKMGWKFLMNQRFVSFLFLQFVRDWKRRLGDYSSTTLSSRGDCDVGSMVFMS